MATDTFEDFSKEPFTADGETKQVVVVMTEIPGITPLVADFARRVEAAGHTVALPDLFGDPGRAATKPYELTSLLKRCVSKEFVALATEQTSPVTVWLRALVDEAPRRGRGWHVSHRRVRACPCRELPGAGVGHEPAVAATVDR